MIGLSNILYCSKYQAWGLCNFCYGTFMFKLVTSTLTKLFRTNFANSTFYLSFFKTNISIFQLFPLISSRKNIYWTPIFWLLFMSQWLRKVWQAVDFSCTIWHTKLAPTSLIWDLQHKFRTWHLTAWQVWTFPKSTITQYFFPPHFPVYSTWNQYYFLCWLLQLQNIFTS